MYRLLLRTTTLLCGGLALLITGFLMTGLYLAPHAGEVVYAQVTHQRDISFSGWKLLLVDVSRDVSVVIDDPALYPLLPLTIHDDGDLLLMMEASATTPVMLRYDIASATLTQMENTTAPESPDAVTSPSGEYVAAWEGEAFEVHTAEGNTIYSITLERPVFRVTWSPDGRWLAIQTSDGILARLYTFNLQRRHLLSMNGPVAGGMDVEFVMWSPDSRYLFGGSSNFTGGFGSVTEPDGANARRLTDESVFYRAWSPSGRYLFYGIRGATGNQLDIRDAAADFGFVDRISNISIPQWGQHDDTLYLITGARGRTVRQLSHFDPATGLLTAISPAGVTVESWYAVRH